MITKKAEYAIIVLTELSSHPRGTLVTSKAISENRSIPVNLVVQLLAVTREAGWTTGVRGPAGGILLKSDPAKISLRQVIEKIDGPIGLNRCLFSDTPCRDKTHCSLRGIWFKAQQNMLDVLDDVSILDLAEAEETDYK